MNKLTSLLIAGASVVSLGVSSVSAQEPIGADLSFGYSSDYVFRGAEFGSDLVDVDLSYGGALTEDINYGVGVWYASFDEGKETNVYGSLDWELLGLGWNAGVLFYNYPGSTDDAEYETSFGSTTSIAGIDFSLTFINYQVASSTETQILEGSAGYSYECSWTERTFDLGLTYGGDISEETNDYLSASVSTDFAVGTGTLTPYVAYNNGNEDLSSDVVFGAYFGLSF